MQKQKKMHANPAGSAAYLMVFLPISSYIIYRSPKPQSKYNSAYS